MTEIIATVPAHQVILTEDIERYAYKDLWVVLPISEISKDSKRRECIQYLSFGQAHYFKENESFNSIQN